MRIIQIGSEVSYDSSIYLVDSERTMLVDCGTGFDHSNVSEQIHRILGDRALDMIVLTHCHFDHVGGAHRLSKEFGCEVYSGVGDAGYIASADIEHTLSGMFGVHLDPVDVIPMGDGDVLDLGGVRFQVLCTPGHTEGSICLYDPVSGSLISGDTLFESGYGRTDFIGGSIDSMRGSILRLSNIDIRELYPGHGIVCSNYGPSQMGRVRMLVGV